MRKPLVSLGAAAALLMTHSAVRAELINFGYSASSAVNPVDSSNSIYNSPLQTSSITFTPANGAATYDTMSGAASQFIVYNMATSSTVKAGVGAAYDSLNAVPFNLSVTVSDLASSVQGTFNFNGTYTADHVSATTSHVDPTSQGITWTTPLSVTQTIAAATAYTMSLVSWTAPGAPGNPGAILAEVTAVPDVEHNLPGQPAAPEPASLLLGALALPALVAARRRRKDCTAEAPKPEPGKEAW